MTTRAFSGTAASPSDDRRNDKPRDHDDECHESDHLPLPIRARAVIQLDLARAGRYWNREQRVVAPQDSCGLSIDARTPVEVPVFRNHDVARVTRCRVQLDGHLPGVPGRYAGARRRWWWQAFEGRRV